MERVKNVTFLFEDRKIEGFESLSSLNEEFSLETSSEPADSSNAGQTTIQDNSSDDGDKFICTACNLSLANRQEQTLHYKLDFHRFNLKYRLKGKLPVSEDEFERLNDAISSLSGSESTSDDEEDEVKLGEGTPYTFFKGKDARVFGMWKVLVMHQRQKALDEAAMLESAQLLLQRPLWAIFLVAGGHFAGAIFNGVQVMAHKTLHRYTVRAKRGTAQSVHDSKSGKARSAGATLRRHHEKMLNEDVRTTLREWMSMVDKCHLVFIRASPYNQPIFFEMKHNEQPMRKEDTRVRPVPFPTRRPTFNEVQRVHRLLRQLLVFSSVEDATRVMRPRPTTTTAASAAKTTPAATTSSSAAPRSKKTDAKPPPVEQQQVDRSVDAQEVPCTEDVPASQLEDDRLRTMKNALFTACKTQNTEQIEQLLATWRQSLEPPSLFDAVLQFRYGASEDTLLHLVASLNSPELVALLLENGFDPSVANGQKQLPYLMSTQRPVRDAFRHFMASNPDRYDYKTAQIPPPPPPEQEEKRRAKMAEKRKTQKTAKKQRDHSKKEEEECHRKEEEVRLRYLSLSDREKRALAAEKRIVEQHQGQATPVLSRCWQCGRDMTGQVPFEYSNYCFCCMACLKEHRSIAAKNAKKPT